nr:MAG TPA: hypothetical protein [Caudoviricetes sp.]
MTSHSDSNLCHISPFPSFAIANVKEGGLGNF